jgi:hypothetical protein
VRLILDELEEAITWQLYHLPSDPTAEHYVSGENRKMVQAFRRCLLKECDGNLVHGTPEAYFAVYG